MPLANTPEFKVTSGGQHVLSGRSIYWGAKWTQHFYVINLSALNTVGDYLLVCDGDAVELHVSESAHSHIRHRGGSDTTVFSDIVDGKGFVGHWAHIDNWWSPDVMEEPYWLELDLDVNDKTTGERTKIHEPRQRIANRYFGGWDHTDLYGSSQKCSAMVLRELAFAYRDNPVPVHNRVLINEMIYGAEYFVRIQNKDGSWPYKTNVITKLTGGVAADVRDKIRKMAHALYMRYMDDHSRSTPFRGLEGSNGGYGNGVQCVRRAALFYTMYQKFGGAYGAGYLVAERVMDWTFGCNPFATSTVFGCGDVFAIYGWARGYEKGSLLPGLAVHFDSHGMVTPIELTATQQGYGNSESEAGAGVAFIHAMALRHALRECPPTTVSFYSKNQYQGFPSKLPAGVYNEGQMKAYGILGQDISSLKIPNHFKVTLYAESGGDSIVFTSNQEDLQPSGWDDKINTIRIDASP